MAFILDTDLLSILQSESNPAFAVLHTRMVQHGTESFFSSVISLQEQIQGWLAFVNRHGDRARIARGYYKLLKTHRFLCGMKFLPFDDAAEDRFAALRQQKVRINTLDLRIASIALATDSVLLSRNLKDFRQVPGLTVEDWTR